MTLSDSATVAAISLLVTTVLNFAYRYLAERGTERASIESRTDTLIKLAMDYPHVERRNFVMNWTADGSDESVRYEQYCCYVFNLLEELHRYYKGDLDKMNRVLAFAEIITQHALWWRTSQGVQPGYNPEFYHFVECVIDTPASWIVYPKPPDLPTRNKVII